MELLIKKAIKGDEESFFKLIDGLMTKIYKVAKSRLNDEDAIGDAIQETIIAAYSNISKVKEPKYFNTWLIKILINKCNDIVKDRKIVYIEDYNLIEDTNLTYSMDLEQCLDFDNLLNCLSPDYRTVIVLYYVNKFTTKEISQILNEKEGTIKSRLSRSRSILKDLYLNEKSYGGINYE
ncbi:MAG: sigma-70 family RNA polymerase sigma factor [Clostridium sp.]|uniref:sigma-70 family RNA polymerase sigma factor n=1 Tax=Clostridium sp. TaxID=1506 RepID=UPI002FCAB376